MDPFPSGFFRSPAQRAAVCQTILSRVDFDTILFTDEGPTPHARELHAAGRKSGLSIGAREFLAIAFDIWDGSGRITFQEVLFAVAGPYLEFLATFMAALSQGPQGVEKWLTLEQGKPSIGETREV